MSSDLVHRLRTCAAAIVAVDPKDGWVALVTEDAANLLLEASNEIAHDEFMGEPPPKHLGEPMEIIEPLPPKLAEGPTWTTGAMELPGKMNLGVHQPKPCPSCHILAPHTVRRANRSLVLQCGACGHKWDWVP